MRPLPRLYVSAVNAKRETNITAIQGSWSEATEADNFLFARTKLKVAPEYTLATSKPANKVPLTSFPILLAIVFGAMVFLIFGTLKYFRNTAI